MRLGNISKPIRNNERSGIVFVKVTVKVKLSLVSTEHYAMKAYWRSGGIQLPKDYQVVQAHVASGEACEL
jgi:hypothetical protein